MRDKTKITVVHFRKAGQKQTNFVNKINEENVSFADCYEYLGFQLSCHLNYTEGMELLSDASSRVLGMLISK